ncbi:MAG TPA: S8 family serine peptidase [Melioribacteraceae bacterium]|nr:S8 family serine peptidase [Melioribacteraceae bacterium]
MRTFLTLSFLLVLSITSFSQNKYFITFKDKGNDAVRLGKSSAIFQEAEKLLTKESIERRKSVMGENYITLEDLPVSENYVASLESLGIEIIHKLKWFNSVSCYLTDAQLNSVKQLSFVKSIEEVKSFKRNEPVEEKLNNPPVLYKSNYLLDYGPSLIQNELSEIPVVHDLGINGQDVIIGLLDTGFRKTIPALQGRTVLGERDFIQNDNTTSNQGDDATNQDSHGTHVFSIIGGYAPGFLIGPAFGAKYYIAKTEDVRSERNVEEDNYAAALEWMESQGVHITSSSLGYSTFDVGQTSYLYSQMDGKSTKVAQAANLAFERGVSTFSSAGNEGPSYWGINVSGIQSPADAFNLIAVGAVDRFNTVTSFSSRGPTFDGRIKPEIVAQGSQVQYGNVSNQYGSGGGTSYSAPIAAGVAALLKSAFPHLTNVQIRQILLESGDNAASPNNERGYGLISAKRAITYPNLSGFAQGQPVINKIFIANGGINENSIKIYIRETGGTFQQATMVKKSTLVFSYDVLPFFAGKKLEFYFEYQDNSGSTFREPVINNYRFTYGGQVIDNVLTDLKEDERIPSTFSLAQNYPNPFNPETKITYTINRPEFVSLKVFDLLGREVTTLVNEFKQPGVYTSQFSIGNSALSSGVYFYTLKAGDFVQSKKMLVLK